MSPKSLLLLLSLSLVHSKLICQQDSSKLKITCDKNAIGDTLWLSVHNDSAGTTGSLMIVASSEKAAVSDTFFLPIVGALCNFAFVVPPQFRTDNVTLKGFYYPKIFSIKGKLLGKKKYESLFCLLITNNLKIYNEAIILSDDNSFSLPGLVFENSATVVFKYIGGKKKDKPDVEIEQFPETAKFTNAVFFQQFDLTPDSVKALKDSLLKIKNIPTQQLTYANDKVKLLKNVTVTAVRKSSAQKYNELYSNGLFKDPTEKVIDCLDNDNILSFPDCLSYLRSQIAGLMLSTNHFGENSLKWRGKEVKAFYIDEIPVDIEQIIDLNLADIAIIKAYPPPFFGSGGNGDGGAVGVYTRTGDFIKPGVVLNKWLYSVKGYTPAVHVLFEKNLN
jgi:hypothetical protein